MWIGENAALLASAAISSHPEVAVRLEYVDVRFKPDSIIVVQRPFVILKNRAGEADGIRMKRYVLLRVRRCAWPVQTIGDRAEAVAGRTHSSPIPAETARRFRIVPPSREPCE